MKALIKAFSNQIFTISSIIIVLLYFKNLYEPKQHLSQLKKVEMFSKNPKNYPIVPLLWLNDMEIVWDVVLGCESESIGQGRSYIDKYIYISFCFFSRSLSFTGDGGVIYVKDGSYSMYINNSMFFNCGCSQKGGAIYFSSSNSYLRMICANSCSCGTSNNGHFAYLRASQDNQGLYLSVSNCSYMTSGYDSILIYSGKQRVDNTNSSMNHVLAHSGIYIYATSSFTGSHCTFSNNKASGYICLCFFYGTISMSYASIVQNSSPSQYGVVYVDGAGSKKMMYCIFHGNQNTLFCVAQGSLDVSHSFINHTGSFSKSTSVSTYNNNSFTYRITYQIQFFNSLHCNADIPLEQSSFEETIRRTNEDTLRMTYERTIDQTIRETLINTQNESPMNTLEQSPINTIDQTIKEPPNETIPRSYTDCRFAHQMAKKREIRVIFSFSFIFGLLNSNNS